MKRKAVVDTVLGLLLAAVIAVGAGAEEPAFRCVNGEGGGLPGKDVAAAVDITCDVLRARSGASGTYSVTFRPLGRSIQLRITDETTSESRSILLPDLEETELAANRVARALLDRVDVEETQRVGSLPSETRGVREKAGTLRVALGAVGLSVPFEGTGFGGGISLGILYDTPRYALYGDLTGAGGSEGESGARLFSIGSGVRCYFTDGGISPFLAAGAGLLAMDVDSEPDFHAGKTSFAPHVEAGIVAFRLQRSRLSAGLRVHLPLSRIEDDHSKKLYAVPVVFGLTFAFGG
jgi:hypothetical protein